MNVTDAIRSRRSVKQFTGRAVTRAELESLLETVAHAPNHHVTQPWRFHVLGPEARHAYGLALGARKAKKLTDPDAARALKEKVANEHRALPAMIAVACVLSDDPQTREEDYAAVMMGVQNLALAAVAAGLGTHIKTGAIMDDPAARAAAGARDGERIVAIVNVGEPAESVAAKPRTSAASLTTWVP
ncbi:MAG TPA: nitroreductase family protein [Gemmatimonadaceae bacterium]|nr:nitroreductase family protein [Gemmatimonadaceae bacterium]